MKKLNLCLSEWQARFVLQALNELEARWQTINRTTQDETERAEFANDLVELGMTKRQIENEAVEVFGRSVNKFGRTAD